MRTALALALLAATMLAQRSLPPVPPSEDAALRAYTQSPPRFVSFWQNTPWEIELWLCDARP